MTPAWFLLAFIAAVPPAQVGHHWWGNVRAQAAWGDMPVVVEGRFTSKTDCEAWMAKMPNPTSPDALAAGLIGMVCVDGMTRRVP